MLLGVLQSVATICVFTSGQVALPLNSMPAYTLRMMKSRKVLLLLAPLAALGVVPAFMRKPRLPVLPRFICTVTSWMMLLVAPSVAELL